MGLLLKLWDSPPKFHGEIHEKPVGYYPPVATVEEIHETFYTEMDRLLAEAKILNSLETNKQSLIDKHNRLVSLGFTNTKEVIEAGIEINRLNKLNDENIKKHQLSEAINYFSTKYPHYKFITEDSVKKICEKYGLVYGNVSKYKGIVPDKNLKAISEFKIDNEDECYNFEHWYTAFSRSLIQQKYINFEKFKELRDEMLKNNYDLDRQKILNKCPLEIAALPKDFDMTDSEIKNLKVVAKIKEDPIVLQPVLYNGQKHYLIVTAWGGPEATDELVVNEKMN